MAREVFSFILLVVAALHKSSGNLWETTKGDGRTMDDRFQAIPPLKETADKLTKNFLNYDLSNNNGGRSRRAAFPEEMVKHDVVFLIDSSRSLTRRSFHHGLKALRRLTERGRPNTRYAAITFSKHAKIEFNFSSQADTEVKLRSVKHMAGATNTQEALRKCRTEVMFNDGAGARQGSYKSVLIVTDGQSNVHQEKTLFEAFQLKNSGVQVFVVAVGKYIEGIAEVMGLASSTDAHMFRVADTESFLTVVKLIPPWNIIRQRMHRTWLEGMAKDNYRYSS